ncbi:Uncharacterized protein TCM_028889 [Theobroma cacao]|uniref:Uncharacterized protein n=1 Tax=Theobroma cacao TaxID=3641 RepID=A0A061GCP2_THECC|nr:Uncharacterized protein TCM_028889 [Theobroma cacao]
MGNSFNCNSNAQTTVSTYVAIEWQCSAKSFQTQRLFFRFFNSIGAIPSQFDQFLCQ